MKRISAGILMFRRGRRGLEFFLAHPGGPYFRKKDDGAWTIPKGEPGAGEDLRQAALREFREETGIEPVEPLLPLESVRQKGGKTVFAWAFEGDWSPERGLPSNTFEIEWPPRSGQKQAFPEIDNAAFFSLEEAKQKINPAQVPFLERLEERFREPG